MLNFRRAWLAASLILVGGLLVIGPNAGADEKKAAEKKVEKKKQPKAGGSLLNKSDELTDQDEKDTPDFLKDSPRKVYKIKLTEGKSYQIDLKSMDFDAVLRLEDADGKQVAFNDDFELGKSLDSRIVYKATKTEEYKIIATCLDQKTGKFTLTVVEAVGGASASIFKGNATELKDKDGKGRYEGELTDKDPVVRNHYYKVFTFKMEEGKTYRIDHMSDDIDAYLFLEDPDGITLAQDDDGGDGLNSRIIHLAKKTGLYRIIPTTLPPNKTGKFILEVKAASADEEKEVKLLDRTNDAETAAPAEQKKLLHEVLKLIQGKEGKLNANHVQMALQVTAPIEGTAAAPDLFEEFGKQFTAANNPRIVGFASMFEKVGKELSISGKTLSDKDYDLKNMKGKVVLVDFWGTWCPPCVAEVPNMVKAYEKYHKRGFDIIGVASDRNDEVVSKFIEARKLPWPCINVEDSKAMVKEHDVNSFPTPILVDRSGRIVSMRARGPHLEKLLERMLPEKK
jgi:thiol-disulfide isomerase/thioredoxin